MRGQIHQDDFCFKHNDRLLFCERCGAGLLAPFIEVIDGTVHIYCGNCIDSPR